MKVILHMPLEAYQYVECRVAELREVLRGTPASVTTDGYVTMVLVEALGKAARRREAEAQKLLWQFDRVWRAVAAHAFKRCGGAVSIEDLRDAAREEALKACRKVNGKGSPAALIRVWANYGVVALLKERMDQSQFKLIYPDTDERSRWDVLPDEAASPDARCGAREVSDRLQELVADLPGRKRQAAGLLAQGHAADVVARRARMTLEEVAALRETLAARLGVQLDEELAAEEAAQMLAVPVAKVVKIIQRGKLQGQQRGGRWYARKSDVMALVRLKEAA